MTPQDRELMLETDQLVTDAVEAAVHAAAAIIQRGVGVKEGDVASAFFTNTVTGPLHMLLRQYYHAEVADLAQQGLVIKKLLRDDPQSICGVFFLHRGVSITDPTDSECGRFKMNAIRDYGLTPGQVAVMRELNADFVND